MGFNSGFKGLMKTAEFGKALKLKKNGKSPGENEINSELNT